MSTPFVCDTCFDTRTVDQGGREITCPDCSVVRYHPSSVFVRFDPSEPTYPWQVIDNSQVAGTIYSGSRTQAEAVARCSVRRRVIKAAVTRRANKAKGI